MSSVSLNTSSSQNLFQSATSCLPVSPFLHLVFERTIKNPFFWALALPVGSICTISFAAAVLPPFCAVGISAACITLLAISYFSQSEQTTKWMFCELSLMRTVIDSTFLPASAKRSWYSPINEHLTLGANPLRSHLESLKQEGHTAVLSVVEPFETDPHLFGVPLKPEDWAREGITFLNLPNPDSTHVRDEDVERGVAYLHQQISLGKRVYVHCHAGLSRSATIVICYLIKHQGMSPENAVAFVNSKRTIYANENSLPVKHFVERLVHPSSH